MPDKREIYRYITVIGGISFLPVALGAGVFGGYVLGEFLRETFGLPRSVTPALVLAGAAASVFEAVRIIKFIIRAGNAGKK